MNVSKSKINGFKPRINPIERFSVVLIEWINRIIIAKPRNIEAMMAHAAIPLVDDE